MYIDYYKKRNETSLPSTESFNSNPNTEGSTENNDYTHAQHVWNIFKVTRVVNLKLVFTD